MEYSTSIKKIVLYEIEKQKDKKIRAYFLIRVYLVPTKVVTYCTQDSFYCRLCIYELILQPPAE